MEAQVNMLHLLAQSQKELELDVKQHPEPSENWTVWKSDKQGFKEATFIQTGRRGGEAEMRREVWRAGEVQRSMAEWLREEQGQKMGAPTSTCGR